MIPPPPPEITVVKGKAGAWILQRWDEEKSKHPGTKTTKHLNNKKWNHKYHQHVLLNTTIHLYHPNNLHQIAKKTTTTWVSRTVSVVSPGNVTFWKWRWPEMIKSMPYLAHPDLQLEFSWLATAKWDYHTHYSIEKKRKIMCNEYRICFACHNILCAVNTYIYVCTYITSILYAIYISLYWYFWWTLCHKSTYLCFLKTTTHLTFCWTITNVSKT